MKKFATILSLFALLAVAQAVSHYELSSLWGAWKTQHQKSYAASEENFRFAVFSHNYKKILKFNEENDTPKLAINHFADLTADEFKAQYANGGFAETDSALIQEKTQESFVDVEALPASIDWRSQGAVTAVKNQGDCGGCWAFSTTGVLEGYFFLYMGAKLLSFSEQQIIDCDTGKNQGCDGGFPYLALEYAAREGLELESDYPFTGQDGTCRYNVNKTTKIAGGYSFVSPNSTAQLKNALVNSPVSVLIEADQDTFQFYSSGVIKTGCGANLDHAVLAVGYHKVGPLEAFIVKNSWGTSWGEDGYVQIWSNSAQNGGQGVCGILSQPVIATN